jgi:hypothetical protein
MVAKGGCYFTYFVITVYHAQTQLTFATRMLDNFKVKIYRINCKLEFLNTDFQKFVNVRRYCLYSTVPFV